MKKRDIYEVLDSDGNLIGTDDMPANNPNEISADGTTDHNAAIGHQHFAHDFLGRFGFYMYNESEGVENPLVGEIAKETYNYFEGDNDNFTSFENLSPEMQEQYKMFGNKIVGLLKSKSQKPDVEPTLSESELSKMIEDVITQKTDKSISSKKGDNDVLDGKVKEKIKSLYSTLSDKDKGELVKSLK